MGTVLNPGKSNEDDLFSKLSKAIEAGDLRGPFSIANGYIELPPDASLGKHVSLISLYVMALEKYAMQGVGAQAVFEEYLFFLERELEKLSIVVLSRDTRIDLDKDMLASLATRVLKLHGIIAREEGAVLKQLKCKIDSHNAMLVRLQHIAESVDTPRNEMRRLLLESIKDGANVDRNLRSPPTLSLYYQTKPSPQDYRNKAKLACQVIKEIAEKKPGGYTLMNANDLGCALESDLHVYIEGIMSSASSKGEINFTSMLDDIKEVVLVCTEYLPKATGYSYPSEVRKLEFLALRVIDVKNSELSPKEAFAKKGKNLTNRLNELIALAVPTYKYLSEAGVRYFRAGEFDRKTLNLGAKSSANDVLGRLEGVIDFVREPQRIVSLPVLVAWEGSKTPHGIKINGNPILHMQHGRIMTQGQDDSEVVEVGVYDRVEEGAGEDGKRHLVILYLNPDSSIEVDADLAKQKCEFARLI